MGMRTIPKISAKRNAASKTPGFFDDDTENGFITRELEAGIRDFQRENGLKTDGVMRPGGETEAALFDRKGTQENDSNNRIGFGGNSLGTLRVESGWEAPASGATPAPQRSIFSFYGPAEPREKREERPERPEQKDDERGFITTKSGARVNPAAIAQQMAELSAKRTGAEQPEKTEHGDGPIPIPAKKQQFDATGRMAKDNTPPVPERKPSIFPGVDDETLKAEVVEHEKPIHHMYKDSTNNVTVGSGFKINNAAEAKQYPFTVSDGKGGRRAATDTEIERAFKKVNAVDSNNHKAESFKPGKGQKALQHDLDDLRLPEDVERRILDAKMRERARDAMQKLKNDGINPDDLPPSIKKLVFDLQYNTGLGGPKERAPLFDPIRNRDWNTVKNELKKDKYKIAPERDQWRLKQIDEAQVWERKKDR